MMNTIRLYSTNINSQELLNSHKINDFKTLYILPSIELDDPFCIALQKTLSSLDSDAIYNFEFYACTHTNYSDKKFLPSYPGMNNIYQDNDEHFIKYIEFRDYVRTLFKFKGYTNVLSNSYVTDLEEGIVEYVYNAHLHIKSKIYVKPEYEKPKQWFEYKKPIIFIATKKV
jgi:hypothetical protein